ncbi:hypothetical protein ACFMPD_14780 [Sedimentitalea sp. HM32M-2]|uniref:hypothetical protein n=1 Tax=Sedimentitalea sp. HM32M-2 TaxID=3351566 RepID=UPI003638B661
MADIQTPAKTVVLHIGLHKTGTSSIQATLKHNHGLLRRRGLLFPGFLPVNQSQFFINAFSDRAATYHANRRQGLGPVEIRQQARQHLRRLGEVLGRFDGGTVVLSAEDACTFQPPEVARVRARLDGLGADLPGGLAYRVLLYTRDPVAFVSSAMQENVKGNGMRLEDSKAVHIRNAAGRYRRIHDHWAAVFGAEAVQFRSFETACAAPGGLVADFLRTLGVAPGGIAPQMTNEGISDEVTEFLSSLYLPGTGAGPGQLQDCRMRVALTPEDRAVLFALRGSKGGLLPLQDRIRTWDAVAEDMRFLQEQYGIVYRRPEAEDAPAPGKFGADFLRDLAAALPQLSEPARQALLGYLLQRPPAA